MMKRKSYPRRAVKKKWQGKSANRYDREPMERRFAQAWQHYSEPPYTSTINDLLDTSTGCPKEATDEERIAANTVIQWLGSPVGLAFLEEVLGVDLSAVRFPR